MNTITVKRKRNVESKDPMQEFTTFFNEFVHQINGFDIYEKHLDQFYNLLVDFTKQYTEVIYNQWTNTHVYQNINDILRQSETLIIDNISSVKTKFKRNKLCENNSLYVEPVEKGIELKWMCKIDSKNDVPFHGQNISIRTNCEYNKIFVRAVLVQRIIFIVQQKQEMCTRRF